jgi:hypothetical protein
MQSGYKRRQECEPAPRVKTFKAEFENPRGRKKPKLGLVPALLKTPNAKDDASTVRREKTSGRTSTPGYRSGARQDEIPLGGLGNWDQGDESEDVQVEYDIRSTSQYLNVCDPFADSDRLLLNSIDTECLHEGLEAQQRAFVS